jgi:hypothetical protein
MKLWTQRAVGVLTALALAGAVGCEREAAAQQGQPGTQQAQQPQAQQAQGQAQQNQQPTQQPRQQFQQPQQQFQQPRQFGQQQPRQQFQQPQQQFGQQNQQPQQRRQFVPQQQYQAIGGGPTSVASIRQFTQWADTVANIELVNHKTASTGLYMLWAATDAIIAQANLQRPAQYGSPQGGGPAPQYGWQRAPTQVSPQGYNALATIRKQQRHLRNIALELEETDNVIQHPFLMRNAAMSTVSLFDAMSQVGLPDASDQIERVRELSQQLDINTPIVAQATQVRDFLESSAQVVDQMSQNIQVGAVGGGPQQGQQPQGEQQDQGQQQRGQQQNQGRQQKQE